ncbi:uncharacterized protein KY384_008477 [Bacidia gigantensis]|uniref:uncharacterized protein n=1 Tax=Bacidia gigantensis TaxID=2732470 RepID=UPI001D03E0F0|nr:uncharacterized protein KY384_008477 [Bacidia gigantensis]KAG8527048.1 hypothetical protein KY384_008477 [Bacidia gigantensis]
MADPLSITSGLIAILQLTKTVVKYLRDVSDATSQKNVLLLELSSTKGILETLNDLSKSAGDDKSLLSSFRLLQEPLRNYEALLTRLDAALAPAHGLKKVGKAFKWPFDKAGVQDILASIERYKALFGLALQADNIALSKAVKHELGELRNRQKDDEMREIIQWLSPLNFATRHQDIFSKHQEGTGQWFLDDDKFVQWKTGNSRLIWCPGVPGAGKTVLSSIVVDYLMNSFEDDDIAVVGIYCDFKEFNQQSTSKYLASLLQQMIIQHGSIPDQIKDTYVAHSKKKTTPAFPEYLDLLKGQMQGFTRVYIVIDALDECTEANGVREELLEGILQMPTFTSIMITSRYIPVVEDSLQAALRLDISARDDDIHLHVRSRLAREKTWARRIRLDSVLQTKIAKSIVERASGMFLLAQLHISSIVRKHSKKDVENALRELPEGLSTTYDQILQRIDDQGEEDAVLAREVLSWLTFALRPLKVTVLQQALAIKPQGQSFDEDALIHDETILAVCAGIVVIDEESSVIHFVHYTTQEYFIKTRRSAFPTSPLNILTTCLTFLLFDQSTKEDMMDLYIYVADNWGHHVRESPETPQVVDKIIAFLTDEARVKQGSYPFHSMKNLHLAARFDLAMTMGRLLELDSADINIQDENGRTPLYYAAGADKGFVVNLLLTRSDVQIDLASYYDGPPLHHAIEAKQEDIARVLLERGVNPESKDTQGLRPIHKAIMFDPPATVKILLDRKIDVTAMTNTGHTPLEMAMPRDSLQKEKAAKSLWRDPEVTASTREYTPCLELLLNSLTESEINRGDMLFEATKDGRPDIALILLNKGAQPSLKSKVYNQRIPLHWAAEKNFYQISELLIQHGSDVDSQDKRGFTPMHYAASAGHEEIVKLLLPQMTSLDIKANHGITPHQCAQMQGHQRITNMLLEAGASDTLIPESVLSDTYSIRRRHKDNLATRLSGKNATSDASAGEYKKYAERLILASAQGDMEGVLLCLNKGVSVAERDHVHHKTALHWACENDHVDIAQVLLEKGSSLASQDQYGETPLHYAADSGCTEIVDILLQRGSDMSVKDDRERTALRCARDGYHVDTVKVMVRGWDGQREETEEMDKQGKSLAHWAAEIGDQELWEKLKGLQLSDDAMAEDERGWKPEQYALRSGVLDGV